MSVPNKAKQTGEVQGRWAWTEPSVWTGRMLEALERGIKGGKWFSLIDKVYRPTNLQAAFVRVKRNGGAAGVDHQTITMFENQLERRIDTLATQLQSGHYRPQLVKRVHIPKPGSRETRPLGIPTVRDRITQTAIRNVIEPIFEHDFAEHSYGFRPGRGCKDALRRVDTLLKEGYRYVVDADLKGYFDTIPHDRLMDLVREKIADGRVLKLIESFLTQGVMDGLDRWTPTAGSPQGAVISPLLSNIYLNPLDQLMANADVKMIRYADDFVILCRSEREARETLSTVQEWTASAGLTLHPEKTHVADVVEEGFEFLGYLFKDGKRRPRKKSVQKLQETIRSKTRRLNGHSLETIVQNLNESLRGWFEYFKHSQIKADFKMLDRQIRRRLRRILLKRHRNHTSQGRGKAHVRWRNAYFAEMGLFSLEANLIAARQSVTR